MAPFLREPPTKPVWPPKNYEHKVEVTMADDWWILAANHGRTDPWDIIVFNFNTRDPNEVNWYLKNWVGCTTTTSDGKNFEFGNDAGKKLYIYIPPASWTPPTSADDFARDRVCQVLNSPAVGGMRMSVTPYHMSIEPHHFKAVLHHVNTGRIEIRFDPTMTDAAAEYKNRKDTMILSSVTTDPFDRSTIVHEAVHASFDDRRSQGVYTQVVEEECFAHIVQMRFLQGIFGPTMPNWGEYPAKPIWVAAWKLANDYRSKGRVDYQDALDFKDVLTSTRGPYKDLDHNENNDHDGIR